MKNSNQPQTQIFDENRISNYVKKFSFPRLCGTDGESRAVELTYNTFKEIGFNENEIQREHFEFSDFYSTTLIQLIGTISLTCILILLLTLYINPYVTIFLIAGMAFIVTFILRSLKHPEYMGFWAKYYGDTIEATNIIIKVPAKDLPEEKAGDVIISAHLDSKSQSYRTVWRIIIYRMWLFGGITFGALYLIVLIYRLLPPSITTYFANSNIFNEIFQIMNMIIIISAILVSLSNAFLIFLTTKNKSPGALDNASGMAVVFELSSFFKKHPLGNFNLWFCQFSAEELGTMGSRIFVNNHEDEFEKEKVFQINLDMVSSARQEKKNQIEYLKSYGMMPPRKIAPMLSEYLDKASKEENISVVGFHLTTGAHTDSVPFHLRGYHAVDLTTRAAAIYTHSKNDTPDKVDPKVLRDTCLIVKKVIEMLDKDYKNFNENNEEVRDLP
ncbi:MAG: M28 family peptidase [Promethearchaeota archaeon]|nr:MAG: M28 family peptidase [Candidatus Lokiarchaeota archaeon]